MARRDPVFRNVSPAHEELRRELGAAVMSYSALPPLERLAVIAIFLGQQIALTTGYDLKNIMDMTAANIHFGTDTALDARKIISF